MLLTSRSQEIAFDICPRNGFLSYCYRKTPDAPPGLQPVGVSIPLLTGAQVHIGLAELLSGKPVKRAVEDATAGFRSAVSRAEMLIAPSTLQSSSAYPPEVKEWTIAQECALIEGFIRAFDKALLPALRSEFTLLEIEKEGPPIALGEVGDDTLFWQWRPDGVALKDDELVILSFKTSSAANDRTLLLQLSRDDQAISESWALSKCCAYWHSLITAARTLPTPASVRAMESLAPKWYLDRFREMPHPPRVAGTQIIVLLKGRRKEEEKGSGRFIQHSPLIRGYRQDSAQGLGDVSYAWSWDVPKVSRSGSSYMGVLGNSWKPFFVWEDYPGGVEAWIELLASGTVQPECGNPLEAQFLTPELVVREDRISESWERQLRLKAVDRAKRAIAANDALQTESIADAVITLDRLFPQHRSACVRYGSLCPMDAICSGPLQVLADPLASGIYVSRIPHHEVETEE